MADRPLHRAPVVREDDTTGLLHIDWPKPRPVSFEITADVFDALVTLVNIERQARRG